MCYLGSPVSRSVPWSTAYSIFRKCKQHMNMCSPLQGLERLWSVSREVHPRAISVLLVFLVTGPLVLSAQSPDSNSESIDAAVLVGAGDIANCDSDGDELTALLLDRILAETEDAVVFTTGDNVYERGTDENFVQCYGPTWGRHKAVTRPVPGNHDYKNGFLWFVVGGHAGPYFDYFDSFEGQAGDRGDGWYRYEHGGWDVYALNTNHGKRVKHESRQWSWLQRSLRERPSTCSIAYVHHPRFSAGKHGDNDKMGDTWNLLAQYGVDILIAGHEHAYQSFHPQTADGVASAIGIRQFVVGTGGTHLVDKRRQTDGTLDKWTAEHHGVLKLTLHPNGYDWEFITTDGSAWDSGSSSCQNSRNRPRGG